MSLGKAQIDISANLKPLKKGLAAARVAVTRMVSRAGSALTSGFSSAFRIIGAGFKKMIGLAKLTALAIAGIIAASVKTRATFEETSNLFKVAMGSMTDAAEAWVTKYSKSLGLYEGNTKQALGTFQLMLTSMGLTEKAAFDMSKGLVKAAVDISSLRNLSIKDSLTKVRAGLVGSTEPLQSIGILTNEKILKKLALEDPIISARLAAKKTGAELRRYGNLIVKVGKQTKGNAVELTDLEKVQLRYRAILNGSSRDVDDFKNTLDSTSNVFKIINEQIQKSADTIGTVFIGDITNAGIALRNWLLSNQDQIKEWAEVLNTQIQRVVDKLKEYFELAKKGDFEAIFKDIGEIFKVQIEGLKKAFDFILPKAVELGKAIAGGFMDAIKDTDFGIFLAKFAAPHQLKEGTKAREEADRRDAEIERQIGRPGARGKRFEIENAPNLKDVLKDIGGSAASGSAGRIIEPLREKGFFGAADKVLDSGVLGAFGKLIEAVLGLDKTIKNENRDALGEF